MLIVMRKDVAEQDLDQVKQYLIDRDFDFHQSTGANRVILGVIGDTKTIDKNALRAQPGVLEVFKIPAEE
jgi:DAHP synthase ferredoxin-like domain